MNIMELSTKDIQSSKGEYKERDVEQIPHV